jgi:glucose-6-phosphate-specific signal transduction histidine kinase
VHEIFGELTAELESGFAWFSSNVAGDTAGGRVQDMQRALDRARARAERSMRALRPPLLELGIINALQALAQSVLRRHGIACEFSANRPLIILDESSFFAMYRVCQESLVAFARQKHSKSMRIELFAAAESVTLEVADDGLTADDDSFSAVTFRDLREAVETLGGSLEVSRDPRHGTSVILSLPLADGE